MSRSSRQGFRRLAVLAWLVFVLLTLSACSRPRPTVAEWEPTWDRISATISSELIGGEDPSQATCSEVLAFLRSNRAELFPTPDLAIDATVTDWVEIAEDAFFECPPNNAQVGSFAEAYGELVRLQGEIESVLDMDRGS
jgi:hypothetical protein